MALTRWNMRSKEINQLNTQLPHQNLMLKLFDEVLGDFMMLETMKMTTQIVHLYQFFVIKDLKISAKLLFLNEPFLDRNTMMESKSQSTYSLCMALILFGRIHLK